MGILKARPNGFPLAVAFFLFAGEARAAESIVHLKDGTDVRGVIVAEDDKEVRVRVKFGTITYKRGDIKSIDKLGAGPGGDAAEPAGAAEWRDVVVLNSGDELPGLLVSEDDNEVVFDTVMSGKAVSKSLLMRTTISRKEVKEIRKLTDAQRVGAREYLKNVEQEARRDALAEKDLKIEKTQWTSEDGKRTVLVKKVDLEHFAIMADTEKDFFRKTAYRLAKVFNAYKQHFGVDRNQFEKVQVIIFNSFADYYAAIGRKFTNPAFYRPDRKLIVAGFAMAEYKAAIEQNRKRLAELDRQLQGHQSRIDKARADVRRKVNQFSGQLRSAGRTTVQGKAIMKVIRRLQIKWELEVMKMEKPIKDTQRKIRELNRRYDAFFDEYTRHMFRTLYHEGVHAFVDQFLFEEELVKHVPRWLNEGLAQYFELARVEGPRLILGKEDRKKLAYLRTGHRKATLVSMEEVLRAGQEEFLAQGPTDAEESRRHYCQSWLLVQILGEKGRLKKEHLRAFVKALADGRPPMDALPLLTGMSNARLEAEWEARLGSSIKVGGPGSR